VANRNGTGGKLPRDHTVQQTLPEAVPDQWTASDLYNIAYKRNNILFSLHTERLLNIDQIQLSGEFGVFLLNRLGRQKSHVESPN